MMEDILALDAIGQAEKVAAGDVSPLELLEAAIARCEALNPVLNAVTVPLYDMARDAVKAGHLPAGPFRGVPFLLKDFYAHKAGTPTTASSALLVDGVMDHDSILTERFEAAGFVIFGKSNVPEMVSIGTTEPLLYGPSRNPLNVEHTPGGSSGGAAAAVAGGIVAAAHANDGAGSTRIPASYCGLFGLKPSRARITLGPDVGESIGGITAEHVVTKSVRDSAAILDATQGAAPGDPYVAPAVSGSYLEGLAMPLSGLRIAVSTDPFFDGCMTEPEVSAWVLKAAALLESMGHEVTETAPPVNPAEFREVFQRFWPMTVSRAAFGLAAARNCPVDDIAAQMEPINRHMVSLGIDLPAVQYVTDLVYFQGLTRRMGQFLEAVDVLLTPTVIHPAPKLGYYDVDRIGAERAYDRVMASFAFTCLANVTGLPAASIPFGVTKQGLPVGIQITAALGREDLLFRLAASIEQQMQQEA
ncbi:amidase [Pseudodonghicola flavimaris]|uniref:Amidase n=1 Tax=Pseudodonghicola flavimaris TaxID=3050036 RepID=A0ABT7F554_9RHOB|nr:amidase [Pseudodonghicola flavimaris]MDK3019743.1 amidase [Pseudodonghicola flavimaris]